MAGILKELFAMRAHTLFLGEFWTGAPNQPWAEAILVNRETGSIEYVGPSRVPPAVQAVNWRIERLPAGSVGLPAFHDAHNHWGYALFDHATSLASVMDVDGLVETLRSRRERQAGGWLLGYNWNTSRIPRLGTAALDSVANDLPVAVFDRSFHAAQLNTFAARIVGPVFERDRRFGKPGAFEDGLLLERSHLISRLLVLPADLLGPSLLAREQSLVAAGIATFDELDVAGPQLLEALRVLYRDGDLRLPCSAYQVVGRFDEDSELKPMRVGDFSVVGFKDYADGTFSAWSAALETPYSDREGCGVRLLSGDRFRLRLEKALRRGFHRVAIHGVGDRGVGDAIDALATARQALGSNAAPYQLRLEHFELPPPDAIARCRDLGIGVCMQPNFISDAVDFADRLGDRVKRICPHRSVLEAGVPLAFGSDGQPTGPLHGIRQAVLRPDAKEAISVENAVAAYTCNAQVLAGADAIRGRLQVGMEANIVVLSRNVLRRPETLADAAVLATYLRGECLYRVQSALAATE